MKIFNIYYVDIKKFNEFKSNWEYIKCSNCNSFYPVYSPKIAICRYCDSKDISNISKNEYYNLVINNTEDPGELKDILSHFNDIDIDSDNVISGIRKPHYLDNSFNWIGKD